MQTISLQQQRKQKFYLIVPIIVIPCLTLFFYALGGGKGHTALITKNKGGLNTLLPEAQIDTQSGDKMSLYAQALKDSNGFNELKKADPYRLENQQVDQDSLLSHNANYIGRTDIPYKDPNEQKINERLASLQRTLQQASSTNEHPANRYESEENRQLKEQLQAVQEQMRQMSSNQNTQPDPQMEQINTVLNKIMEVQHPDVVKARMEQESIKNGGQVYAISSNSDNVIAKPMTPTPLNRNIGFYGLSATQEPTYTNNPAIEAQVNETQTLTNGATIKLRLRSDILVAGQTIAKGAFVFGNCTVNGERLKINVRSIRYGNKLFPVSLMVYDMDGLEGIKIPGAITRDVTKEGLDQGIQSMNLMTLDPGIGAQAAGAAVQTAKSLFSKKVKLIKVTVRADYPILLVDTKH